MNELLNSLQAKTPEHPELAPGDTVKVHVRIVEGDRERIQIFQGVVIRLRGGWKQPEFHRPSYRQQQHWRGTYIPVLQPPYREDRNHTPFQSTSCAALQSPRSAW